MNDVALVIGLVASTATTVLALGTLMKWLLDAKIGGLDAKLSARIGGLDAKLSARIDGLDAKFDAKFDGVDRRLTNVESDLHVIKQHLIGASAA